MVSTGKEPKLWAIVTQCLIDGLKRKGRAPDTLLSSFGLSEETPREPYREIPLRSYVSAFEAAAVHVGDPNFGLFVARDISPFALGPIGLLFMSATTLGAAYKGFIDYIWLAQQSTTSCMVRDGDNCIFRYRIEDSRIPRKRQDAEFSLAMLVQMTRAFVGPTWRPLEVHFEHAAPANLQGHQALFGAPLYFDQAANELIFPASDLAVRGNMIDRRVSPIVEHYLEMLNSRKAAAQSLNDDVRRLVSDHFPGDGQLAALDAARTSGMSLRTFQRALRKGGENFSTIKQDKRRTLAENYLAASDLSITEIAHILGYADAACFTRACRRWFGMTPSAYRKTTQNGDGAAI